jgi:hypothetical protein
MASFHCPQCQAPIRGQQVFKVRAAGFGAAKNDCRCPACGAPLVVLPNRWQMSGLAVAILTISLRWLVDRAEFPVLWMGLAIGTLLGFAVAAVGILYFPRYRARSES